jgi:GrpB-like predicted nucleotidyltransferase (UPF0157 family)
MSVPAWAHEAISIVEPDPGWAGQAAELRAQLGGLLTRWQVSDIQHIGSTAVPGLAAKPILDLMAGCTDLDRAPEIAAALAGHGWHYVPPELDEQPHRRFFVHVVDGHRHAHLHLIRPGTEHWQRHLAFRDRLRADQELRDEYAALKRRLAAAHASDRETYTQAKSGFIGQALGWPPPASAG